MLVLISLTLISGLINFVVAAPLIEARSPFTQLIAGENVTEYQDLKGPTYLKDGNGRIIHCPSDLKVSKPKSLGPLIDDPARQDLFPGRPYGIDLPGQRARFFGKHMPPAIKTNLDNRIFNMQLGENDFHLFDGKNKDAFKNVPTHLKHSALRLARAWQVANKYKDGNPLNELEIIKGINYLRQFFPEKIGDKPVPTRAEAIAGAWKAVGGMRKEAEPERYDIYKRIFEYASEKIEEPEDASSVQESEDELTIEEPQDEPIIEEPEEEPEEEPSIEDPENASSEQKLARRGELMKPVDTTYFDFSDITPEYLRGLHELPGMMRKKDWDRMLEHTRFLDSTLDKKWMEDNKPLQRVFPDPYETWLHKNFKRAKDWGHRVKMHIKRLFYRTVEKPKLGSREALEDLLRMYEGPDAIPAPAPELRHRYKNYWINQKALEAEMADRKAAAKLPPKAPKPKVKEPVKQTPEEVPTENPEETPADNPAEAPVENPEESPVENDTPDSEVNPEPKPKEAPEVEAGANPEDVSAAEPIEMTPVQLNEDEQAVADVINKYDPFQMTEDEYDRLLLQKLHDGDIAEEDLGHLMFGKYKGPPNTEASTLGSGAAPGTVSTENTEAAPEEAPADDADAGSWSTIDSEDGSEWSTVDSDTGSVVRPGSKPPPDFADLGINKPVAAAPDEVTDVEFGSKPPPDFDDLAINKPGLAPEEASAVKPGSKAPKDFKDLSANKPVAAPMKVTPVKPVEVAEKVDPVKPGTWSWGSEADGNVGLPGSEPYPDVRIKTRNLLQWIKDTWSPKRGSLRRDLFKSLPQEGTWKEAMAQSDAWLNSIVANSKGGIMDGAVDGTMEGALDGAHDYLGVTKDISKWKKIMDNLIIRITEEFIHTLDALEFGSMEGSPLAASDTLLEVTEGALVEPEIESIGTEIGLGNGFATEETAPTGTGEEAMRGAGIGVDAGIMGADTSSLAEIASVVGPMGLAADAFVVLLTCMIMPILDALSKDDRKVTEFSNKMVDVDGDGILEKVYHYWEFADPNNNALEIPDSPNAITRLISKLTQHEEYSEITYNDEKHGDVSVDWWGSRDIFDAKNDPTASGELADILMDMKTSTPDKVLKVWDWFDGKNTAGNHGFAMGAQIWAEWYPGIMSEVDVWFRFEGKHNGDMRIFGDIDGDGDAEEYMVNDDPSESNGRYFWLIIDNGTRCYADDHHQHYCLAELMGSGHPEGLPPPPQERKFMHDWPDEFWFKVLRENPAVKHPCSPQASTLKSIEPLGRAGESKWQDGD